MSGIHHAPQDGSFDSEDPTRGTVRVARDGGEVTLYLDAPGMTDDDRAAHWLTADVSDVCSLEEMR
ncbi:DUF7511 domain-containing protein [Halapricum hydrolyticum]|uniref:DUF7511 domain-containing protein n=1 Tax=Halapricum hydrolyticum TaxID=2979991 RepID=A0AAE3IEY6_9EURY|nr:hypothetical protein [Halapricum hydrolyticum]MCU4719543.1 hypothetical protein [Halapricum hydrolyticum]MCU4728514.1 hypothetical protein [Halapricum hydrolyticum]